MMELAMSQRSFNLHEYLCLFVYFPFFIDRICFGINYYFSGLNAFNLIKLAKIIMLYYSHEGKALLYG